jgi:hypothetical protein
MTDTFDESPSIKAAVEHAKKVEGEAPAAEAVAEAAPEPAAEDAPTNQERPE